MDPNLLRSQFNSHRFGDDIYRAFGAVIPGKAGPRPDAGGGAYIENYAPPLLAQQRQYSSGHVVNRLDIDGENPVKGGFIYLKNGAVTMGYPGIVDDDIGDTKRGDTMIDQGLNLASVGNITGEGRGICAQPVGNLRSEERRVGKECRSRWSAYHEKK